jgi:hypothetical protein
MLCRPNGRMCFEIRAPIGRDVSASHRIAILQEPPVVINYDSATVSTSIYICTCLSCRSALALGISSQWKSVVGIANIPLQLNVDSSLYNEMIMTDRYAQRHGAGHLTLTPVPGWRNGPLFCVLHPHHRSPIVHYLTLSSYTTSNTSLCTRQV